MVKNYKSCILDFTSGSFVRTALQKFLRKKFLHYANRSPWRTIFGHLPSHSCYVKSAFTLAEVMIVFTVIGILTAILVPALFASSPDEERLKAKKAFNTITRAMENLTNAGPYDLNGGMLTSTNFVAGTAATAQDSRNRFLCNNLVEVLNVRRADCTKDHANNNITNTASNCAEFPANSEGSGNERRRLCLTDTNADNIAEYETLQNAFDAACIAAYYPAAGARGRAEFNLETSDGVLWGIQLTDFNNSQNLTVNGVATPAFYNLICIDVGEGADSNFIYGAGIRRDGRILVGTRLQEIITEGYDEVMGN